MLSYLPASLKDPFNKYVSTGFVVYDGDETLVLRKILRNFTWSPIVWQNGTRGGKNFICAHYLGLDFENPQVTVADMLQQFSDSWHILGLTRNHQKQKGQDKPCDRFRLLLKFERPITCFREYQYNMELHTSFLGADESGTDGARMFFPCSEIVSVNSEGEYEWIRDAPSEEEEKAKIANAEKRGDFERSSYTGALSRYALRWIMNVIPEGDRNNTCLRLGCEFYRAGYESEYAMEKILASPTYAGTHLSEELINEIQSAVRNGYRLAERSAIKKT